MVNRFTASFVSFRDPNVGIAFSTSNKSLADPCGRNSYSHSPVILPSDNNTEKPYA